MAEGGGGNDEGNPFSFTKFSKNQTREVSDNYDEVNTTAMFAQPDILTADTKSTPITQRNCQQRKQRDVTCKRSRGEENPFSFKKFLQTGESGSHEEAASGRHIATLDLANDLPDFVHNQQTCPASTREQTTCTVPDFHHPDPAMGQHTTTHPSHVRGSATNSGVSQSQEDMPLVDSALVSSLGTGSHGSGTSPGDIVEGEVHLPDFRQGLPVEICRDACEKLASESRDVLPEVHLPDFALQQGSCSSPHTVVDSDAKDDRFCDDMFQHSAVEDVVALSSHNGHSLPDFLSANRVSPSAVGNSTSSEEESRVNVQNNTNESQLTKLQNKNRQLEQDLEEERERAVRQEIRLKEALDEIEVIRKREMEETAALEHMVQQVEANLSTTTKRAVTAETSVTRLEDEVSALQRRIQQMQLENSALLAGCYPADRVQEQVQSASKQLSSAADQAQLTIQQLLNGVETIKLVSTSLASIGKMSEVNVDHFLVTDDVSEHGAAGYS